MEVKTMSQEQLEKTSDTVNYDLIRSRRRTLSIIVKANGQVVVRAPLRMSKINIDSFIDSKQRWLQKTLSQFGSKSDYKSQIQNQEESGYSCLFGEWLEAHTKKEIKQIEAEFEEQTLKLLDNALDLYSLNDTDLQLDIKFRNYKSRWGACKRVKRGAGKIPDKATLMFNKKLRYLPIELVNYVVIHETAHLFQPNHSVRFWDKVGEILPDYKELRKEMKGYNIL